MVPALIVMHDIVPISVLLITAALCLSIVLFQLVSGVPPVSSTTSEGANVVALLEKAGLVEGAVMYDLGSGWGSLVIALARAFPTAQIRGVEISPVPYWVSRLRTRGMPNVRLRRGNFFDCDLADAQAVTCYLMIKPMLRIADLLDRTLSPGTPVVSLCFWFRDREIAARSQNASHPSAAALYYWPATRT